jgi:hypothetical protein
MDMQPHGMKCAVLINQEITSAAKAANLSPAYRHG